VGSNCASSRAFVEASQSSIYDWVMARVGKKGPEKLLFFNPLACLSLIWQYAKSY
jgi:hypothetical protein